MNRTFDVMIDLSNPRENVIVLKRGDQRATYIRFTLMNNGQKFDLTDAFLATVKGVKPDNTVIYADAEIDKENSVITYQVSDQVTTVKGKSIYEIQITDNELGLITTFNFYINVENIAFDETDYMSQNDLSAFRAYMQKTQRDADATKLYVNAFREAYGDEQVLLNEQHNLYTDYVNYLEHLQDLVDGGYFNGAQGARGQDGLNGVIVETGFVLGFAFNHGNLIAYVADDSDISFTVNSSGHLIASEVR